MKQKETLRMEKLKHIIIAGISRGRKNNDIIRSFQNNFPKIGITHADTIINVSKKLAPFINTWLS